MSIIYVTCKRYGYNADHVTVKQVVEIFKRGMASGLISPSCEILADKNSLVKIIKGVLRITSRNRFGYEGWHSQDFFGEGIYEQIIGAWYWKFTHFVVMNGNGKKRSDVEYDPLGNSWSVKMGKMRSTRVYRDMT